MNFPGFVNKLVRNYQRHILQPSHNAPGHTWLSRMSSPCSSVVLRSSANGNCGLRRAKRVDCRCAEWIFFRGRHWGSFS